MPMKKQRIMKKPSTLSSKGKQPTPKKPMKQKKGY